MNLLIFIISLISLMMNISADSSEIKLTSFKDEQYYGDIFIDKKKYSVVFDTGSNLVWVQSNNSTMLECNSYEDCKSKCYAFNEFKDQIIYFIKYGTGYVGITNTKGELSFTDNSNKINDYEYGLAIFEDKRIFSNVITI